MKQQIIKPFSDPRFFSRYFFSSSIGINGSSAPRRRKSVSFDTFFRNPSISSASSADGERRSASLPSLSFICFSSIIIPFLPSRKFINEISAVLWYN